MRRTSSIFEREQLATAEGQTNAGHPPVGPGHVFIQNAAAQYLQDSIAYNTDWEGSAAQEILRVLSEDMDHPPFVPNRDNEDDNV